MRKSLTMLLIAVILAGYVYFYEIKGGEQRDAVKQKNEKLVALNKDSINVLDISGASGHFRFLKKDKGDWQIEKPIQADADKNAVEGFLSALTNAKKIRTFTAVKKNLGEYGLRTPFFQIHVQTSSQEDSIFIGDNSGIGSNVFTGKGDSSVFLTPVSLKKGAQKTLFEWRDKRILLFDRSKVTEIRLSSPKGNFTFENTNGWHLTLPLQTLADATTVDAMLNKLNSGRMKKVEAENANQLKKYKLVRPAFSVSLFEGADKIESRLIFSDSNGEGAFARDNARPMVFRLDKDFEKTFDKTLFDFRDKKFVDGMVTSADKVEWYLDGNKEMAQKDSSGTWLLNGVDTLETFKMNSFLNKIRDLKATGFIGKKSSGLARYGLQKPANNIVFYKDDKTIAQLKFGKTAKENVYVQDVKNGQLVRVASASVKNLLKSADSYKKQMKAAVNNKK